MHQLWESSSDGEDFKLWMILKEFHAKFREYYKMNITTYSKYINNEQIHFDISSVFYS